MHLFQLGKQMVLRAKRLIHALKFEFLRSIFWVFLLPIKVEQINDAFLLGILGIFQSGLTAVKIFLITLVPTRQTSAFIDQPHFFISLCKVDNEAFLPVSLSSFAWT